MSAKLFIDPLEESIWGVFVYVFFHIRQRWPLKRDAFKKKKIDDFVRAPIIMLEMQSLYHVYSRYEKIQLH